MNKLKLGIISVLVIIFLVSCSRQKKEPKDFFVTAKGSKLYLGEEEFRFLSFNIPNLNFTEDELEFTKKHAYRLPTSFEIEDALLSINQIGGRVARCYTIPVKRKTDTLGIPRYVLAPGKFDEHSFQTMDTLLALANKHKVKLIVPLLNNWKWMGGRPQYAEFRNKTKDEFWTDPQLINDFKKTIHYVLTRKNSVTKTEYRNDKSILCWETGNELKCPYTWTKEIVSYIKSIDKNHLVMDGQHAFSGDPIEENSISDTLVDIVTTHHYEEDPRDIIKHIDEQLQRINGKKPYIVGEFGFLGIKGIEQVAQHIISKKEISGGLYWSLRFHRQEGGFYWHSEPMGGGIYKAVHWPGFDSGFEYNEKELLKIFRKKAFEIRGEKPEKLKTPNPPNLLPIKSVSEISWQGSVGANSYNVLRSESTSGPWDVVGYNISDADQFYTPLFNDESAKVGKSYFYKIVANNIAGTSAPSNIIGPINVEYVSFIDEMKSLSKTYFHNKKLTIETNNDRMFKEIKYRISAEKSAEIIYFIPGELKHFIIRCFSEKDEKTIDVSISKDGFEFIPISMIRDTYYIGSGDYNYWIPTQFSATVHGENQYSYLKIKCLKETKFARVKIDYIPKKIELFAGIQK